MRHLIFTFFSLILSGMILTLHAQTDITTIGQNYIQNFNTLDTTGTTNVLNIDNWESNQTDYRASNGSANNGDLYSFGEIGDPERALGAIISGSASNIYFGTSFKNTSGSELNEFNVEYVGEQWRRGNKKSTETNLPVADTLVFEYSTDATNVNDAGATWKPVTALEFRSPFVDSVTSALDGNLEANKKDISGKFNASLADNSTIFIRWAYVRKTVGVTGARDGLGVDDLSIVFNYDAEWIDTTHQTTVCESPTSFEVDTAISTPSSTSVEFSFTSLEEADGYIVLLDVDPENTNHEFGWLEDSTEYSVGDTLMDSKVVYVGNDTSITVDNLTPNTEYSISVFPIFNCEGGVKYGEFTENVFMTSDISTIVKENVSSDILIYPNPVSNNILNLKLPNSTQGKAHVQVHNIVGEVVLDEVRSISSNMQISLPQHLANGRYTLRIEQENHYLIGSFIIVR